MPSRVVYPAIAFDRSGNFYIYPDRNSLRGRAHDLGMSLLDSAGRGWMITGVSDVGPVDSFWARIAQFIDGEPRRRFEAQLAEVEPMSFEDAKVRACAAISIYPDNWKEDELFAGESGPGFDESKLFERFKQRIRVAATIAEIEEITRDPYKDPVDYYDWDCLLPDATYPVIGLLPGGEIKGYRTMALARCRRDDFENLRLAGSMFIDSTSRCWELIWYREFGTAGSARRWRRVGQAPMHFMDTDFAERGRIDLDELKARVLASMEKRPQQWPAVEIDRLRLGVREAPDLAGLLDVLNLPDDGAWSRQFYP